MDNRRKPLGAGRGRGRVLQDSSSDEDEEEVPQVYQRAPSPSQMTRDEMEARYEDPAPREERPSDVEQRGLGSSHSGQSYFPSMVKTAGKVESLAETLAMLPLDEASEHSGGGTRGRSQPAFGGRGRGFAKPVATSQLGAPARAQAPLANPAVVQAQEIVPVAVNTPPTSDVANASVEVGSGSAASVPIRVPQSTLPTKFPIIQKGSKGNEVPVVCNFLRLKYLGGFKIQEYHVDFIPQLDSTKLKRLMLDNLAYQLGPTRNFDGSMLFLPDRLPDLVTTFDTTHPQDPAKPYRVVVTWVKEKEPGELIQFFNILFRKIMVVLQRVELKRNYYDPINNVKTLEQHKLEIWPGYCTAINEQEGGLMMCVDVSHRVLRTDTVYDTYRLMKETVRDWRDKFTEFIVGKIVLTRYNNMLYKIDDVLWKQTPEHKFFNKKQKREMSFVEYYRDQYTKFIDDVQQPMLLSLVKPKKWERDQDEKTVVLVPELCHVTGLTDEQRGNFGLMKDMGDHTRLIPSQRKVALDKFVSEIIKNPAAQQILSQWNLEIVQNPVAISARVIAGPNLHFGNRGEVSVKAEFTKEATAHGCFEPRKVEKYLVVCTQRDSQKARQFCDSYRAEAKNLLIHTNAGPTILPLHGSQVNDFRKAIKENLTEQYQFVVFLMPQQRDDVYSVIKKMCVSEIGIPSQCILTKTLCNEKRFRSVVQKVAMQINCKLGGSLWAMSIPIKERLMFVGIDVAHDPKRKHPSVVAVVASLNNECTKYVSVCQLQKVHQEIATSLLIAFTDVLEEFISAGGPPARIIVFRDGGAASPESFQKQEVAQVHAAITKMCPQAKFTFIVIQKRISQRFFKTDRMGRNWANPDPGTVIDHTVTEFRMYDFYVVSQLVRQGTVTPTHYVVVEDTGDTKPDLLQKFAYATSFMYFNWSGTVRVPAMTQYAHKLAALVGNFVRAPPGTNLKKSLYYL